MANFIIVMDPDSDRRIRFSNTVSSRVAPLPGLRFGSYSLRSLFVAWAVCENAPIDSSADEQAVGIIWGDAIRTGAQERLTADALLQSWNGRPREVSYEAFDGYHAALAFDGESLILGADSLGLFPLYYYAGSNFFLAGSSPELFRYHPDFPAKFNPSGLVGMLLTMHCVDAEMLWKNVRRLRPGHVLRVGEKSAQEVVQYRLPISRTYFDLPLSAHVRLLESAIEEAVHRHVGDRRDLTLLLSGGLDSRILAGYLKERSLQPRAVTLGRNDEMEVRCAAKVAAALKFPHEVREIEESDYLTFAALQSSWEHGATGFNTIIDWGVHPFLAGAEGCVGGHIMDTIVGPYLEYKDDRSTPSFEQFFRFINKSGFPVNSVERLLRPDVFGPAVEAAVERVQEIYRQYAYSESQRSWAFKIHHRARFHVGGVLWKLSFGAWPIVPGTDRRVLECAGGMPAATLAERRAEKDLLCLRFASLAEIPLDRLSNEPMLPRFRWMLQRQIEWKVARLTGYGGPRSPAPVDRNRRWYDINNAGWKLVRREVEPMRQRAYDFFEPRMLDELLPSPEAEIPLRGSINNVSGIKSLIGFLHWLKDHPV